MLKKLQQRKEGFTIIEVLIVLAIAGLIMLVVFLAVPALQRNSRNTQYRNEASRILGAYIELSSTNGGDDLAASISDNPNSDAKKVLDSANLKHISKLKIEGASGNSNPSLEYAIVRTNAKCDSAYSSSTSPSNSKQIVAIFQVETASGVTKYQCQES